MTVLLINLYNKGDSTTVPAWLHTLVLKRLASVLRLRKNISLSSRQIEYKHPDVLNPPIVMLNPIFEGNAVIEDIMDGREPDKAVTMRERKLQDSLLQVYVDNMERGLHYLTKRIWNEEENSSCSQEWRELAMVLERMFMIIFVCLTIIITLFILLMAANHVDLHLLE